MTFVAKELSAMYIQLNQEDLCEIKNLQEDIKQTLFNLFHFMFSLLTLFSSLFLKTLANYSEYSYRNIKQKGLKNILFTRAIRFFKLQDQEEEVNNHHTQWEKNKKKYYYRYGLKSLRVCLMPIYVVIIVLLWIKNKKSKTFVKNNYKT